MNLERGQQRREAVASGGEAVFVGEETPPDAQRFGGAARQGDAVVPAPQGALGPDELDHPSRRPAIGVGALAPRGIVEGGDDHGETIAVDGDAMGQRPGAHGQEPLAQGGIVAAELIDALRGEDGGVRRGHGCIFHVGCDNEAEGNLW